MSIIPSKKENICQKAFNICSLKMLSCRNNSLFSAEGGAYSERALIKLGGCLRGMIIREWELISYGEYSRHFAYHFVFFGRGVYLGREGMIMDDLWYRISSKERPGR